MKHVLSSLALIVLASPAMLTAADAAKPGARPNIILVLADDTGLSRISGYGGAPFKTPNLDRLAATGVRFDRAYSMPICGPSRAALLTGKYPFRTGAVDNKTSVLDPKRHATLPQLLKQAGYATCTIGKLGQIAPEGDAEAPGRLGFDESMLWLGRGTPDRYWEPRYHRNGQVVQGKADDYGPDLTHAFLVDFMKRHRDRPFFAFYSAVLTHSPFGRTPDSKDEKHHVEDMVAYLDKQMGQLVNDLETLGLRDNTIVIFTSDNGPQGKPLGTIRGARMLGEKGDVREGGVRTPLIVNCPKLVPGDRVCNDLTDFTDLLPTVLELARAKPQEAPKPDGYSIAPQILGGRGRARQWVYAQHGRAYFIADHRYKLYGDGRFVDITDSPVAEKALAAPDDAATKARERLAAALADLRGNAAVESRGRSDRLRPDIPATPAGRAARMTADLRVLKEREIIASADDWLAAVTEGKPCDGEQVAGLITRAAAKFKPATSVNQALEILQDQGVIQSTDYWKQHAVAGGKCSGENVARFVNKLAAKLAVK